MIFKNWSCERIFLMIMVIVGSLLLFLTPPICTPDENCHFLNSYTLANGDFLPEVQNGNIGKMIRNDVTNFVDSYSGKFTSQYDVKYSFAEEYFNSYLQANDRSESFYARSFLANSPFAYVVSASGIAIGRVMLKLWGQGFDTPFNMLLFGRMANLIFYILIGYTAIKNTQYMKKTMLLLLTMPMSLYLGASISLDAVIIPVSMLFFSVFMRLFMSEQDYIVTRGDIIETLICAFFMLTIKQVMIPFLALLFLIPIKKFGTKKKYLLCIISVIGFGILFFVLPMSINGMRTATAINSNAELIEGQKEYILNHLLNFPVIILRTLKQYRTFYLGGFYGTLGILDLNFPIPLILLFFLVLLIVVLIEICQVSGITVMCRIMGVVTLGVSFLGMYYQMYIGWTSFKLGIGADTVTGVQGRYFIPFFLFGCILFMNGKLMGMKNMSNYTKEKVQSAVDVLSELVILIGAVITVAFIVVRYWC